jgi:hypothetical protein
MIADKQAKPQACRRKSSIPAEFLCFTEITPRFARI